MTGTEIDRLRILYQVSQALGSTLDLDRLLETTIDQVIKVTGAERGFLMLGGTTAEMAFQVARGLDEQTIESPQFEVSRSVIARVAEKGESVLSDDAMSDEWLAGRASVSNLHLRSLMCAPLKVQGESIGLVYVDNRVQTGIFDEHDLELLEAIANTAGVAIENARLHELEVQRARLDRELELARQIQTALIPEAAPEFPGYSLAGEWKSAREVAGDFYDFMPRADGGLAVVIGDVTDKGVPAAFFMALARTSIRASVMADTPVVASMAKANQLVCSDSHNGMFVTLYLLHLGAGDGGSCSVSAGHNPPLWLHAGSDEVSVLPGGSLPLGVEATAEYQEHDLSMQPGDVILLYTDGVIDAVDRDMQAYGMDRLVDQLRSCSRLTAKDVIERISSAVHTFSDGMASFDDITLVAVKRD